MNRILKSAMIIAAAGLLLASAPAWGLDYPHDGSNSIWCGSCHELHGSAGMSLTNVAGNSNLCISCHQSGGQAQAKPMNDADRADPYGDTIFRTVSVAGPTGIGRGDFDENSLRAAARIIARYGDTSADQETEILYKTMPDGERRLIKVSQAKESELDSLRI